MIDATRHKGPSDSPQSIVTFSEAPAGFACSVYCDDASCVNVNGNTVVLVMTAGYSLQLVVTCKAPCSPTPYTLTGSLTSPIDNSPSNNVASVAIEFSESIKIKATASTTQLACKGDMTTLTATVSGGSSPFLYSLDTSASTQSSNSFQVGGGDHKITVIDSHACKATSSVVSIGEPLTSVKKKLFFKLNNLII